VIQQSHDTDDKIKVLVVDDRESSREQLARWLRRVEGFAVDTAESGEAAVEIVRRTQGEYDAVVMDQVMSGISGVEAMRYIRAEYPALQVLIFTGQDPNAGVEALRQGAYRYLPKPFGDEELVMTIRAMADAHRQHVRARETGWLQALLRITQNAIAMPLTQLLQEVATAARDLLNGVASIVWTLDQSTGIFHVTAWAGELDKEYRSQVTIDSHSPATDLFLRRGEPIYLPDISDSEAAPPYVARHGKKALSGEWVSLLSAPMATEARVIGILDVYTHDKRLFTSDDRDLISTFANQAAIALENAQLLTQIKTSKQGRELLVSTGQAMIRETTAGLRAVLEKVAESARQITGADCAVIYPYDPERQLFYDLDNVVVHGVRRPLPHHKPRSRGLAAIVREVDELVVHDVEMGQLNAVDLSRISESGIDQPRLLQIIREQKFIQQEGIKSFVGISLKAGVSGDDLKQTEVGVLYIDFRHPHHFNEEELDLIRIFGHQAGSAIQNAWLLADWRRQVEGHRTLNIVGTELASVLHEEEILNTVARAVADTLNCTHCSVFRLESDLLVVRAAQGNRTGSLCKGRAFKLRQGVSGWVARMGKPALVLDTRLDSRFEPGWSTPLHDPQSLVVVPIYLDGQVFGVITAEQDQIAAFDERDQRLLETLSLQTSQAIRNARLHDSLQRQVKRLEVLNQVSRELSTKLATRSVFETVVEAVVHTLECAHCTIFALDDDQLIPQASYDQEGSNVVTRQFRVGEGLVGWVAQSGEAVLVRDASKDERFSRRQGAPEITRSMVVVPVKVNEQIAGVISADQDRIDAFDENDLQMVETLALQTGIALQNASLFEVERQRAAILDLLREVSGKISASLSLDEILSAIVTGAMRLTGMDSGVIHLLDETGQSVPRSYASPKDVYHPVPRLSPSSITRTITDTGRPIVMSEIVQKALVNSVVATKSVKALVGLPIKFHGRVIGVLYLNSLQPRQFSEQELSLLSTLADQAAIAIENARLYEHISHTLERRIRELEVLTEIGQTVSSLGINQILNLTLLSANLRVSLQVACSPVASTTCSG
jgi:GAF domain-containing protein/AmiR/NasT family two-component response regulator